MTDRHAAYIVVLDEDYREDEGGKAILNAIRMTKGVASVEPVLYSYDIHIAKQRMDSEWRQKILGLLD